MYAVDISGAQFGFREPVLPWEEFASQRIQQLEAIHVFGHAKTLTDKWMAKSTAHHIANFWNNKIVSEELIKILDDWLETKKANLAAVMKLKQEAYEEQSSELLAALNEGVSQFVKAGLSNNNLAVAIDTKYQGIRQEMSILMGDGTKHRIDVLH